MKVPRLRFRRVSSPYQALRTSFAIRYSYKHWCLHGTPGIYTADLPAPENRAQPSRPLWKSPELPDQIDHYGEIDHQSHYFADASVPSKFINFDREQGSSADHRKILGPALPQRQPNAFRQKNGSIIKPPYPKFL